MKIGQEYGFRILNVTGLHIMSLLVPLRWQYAEINVWGKLFIHLGGMDRLIASYPLFRHFGYHKIVVARKE